MKRFRNVSAIVSLLAGFITAVVMFINKYDLLAFIWILAVVMAVFTFFIEKKKVAWLDSFSLAGSMLLGMTAAVFVALL